MKKYAGQLVLAIILGSCSNEVQRQNELLEILLSQDDLVDHVLSEPGQFKVQVLYTQIDRDSLNNPKFRSMEFGLSDDYYYPASTVKLPTALMAMEKINSLNIDGLDIHSTMLTDSAFSGQSSVSRDSTSENGLPSIAHYIKKILLVSDNDAFNRLYEFIGQQELNEGLRAKGFESVRFTHRLSIFLSKEENQNTNPVRFLNVEGEEVYSQELVKSPIDYTYPDPILLGKGHIVGDDHVEGPMDFAAKNYVSVQDQQAFLRSLLFPESVSPDSRFNLTKEDYDFVYKYMSMYPEESDYPTYDSTYYQSYVKFFMFGVQKDPVPENIRIFNKVGDAYGFLIDNAYVVDFENGVEFLLTAVVQVNENQVYNDGNYEYDEIGFPFLARIGTIIYQHERRRVKEYVRDLTRFRVEYN